MKQNTFKKLALAMTVGGLMGAAGSAQAVVTYNLQAISDFDEPAFSANGSLCGNSGGACPANGTSAGPWTDGSPGYTGSLPATWATVIQNAGGVAASETASSADAGFSIDMGSRAYKDGTTNWGHTTDFGLFTLQQDANVTISVSSDASVLKPAFGLWKNWATGGSRHVGYTNNGAINPMGTVFTGSGLAVVASDAWAAAPTQGTTTTTATATLTKFLTAGNYTLVLGGYDTTPGSGAFAKYTATISAAAVPVPAAAWLFGPALASLGVIRRRKGKIAA